VGRHATPEELGMASEAMVTHSGEETDVDLVQEAPEFEIEVIDDRPTEDQREAAAKAEELTDEEVKDLGGRAEQRIKKLTWERHEERRAKESAERQLAEMATVAERARAETARNTQLLQRTQAALNEQAVKRADGAIRAAEQRLKIAHETGDVAQIASATQDLTNATVAKTHAPGVARSVAQRWSAETPKEEAAAAPTEEPETKIEVPEPSEKATKWSANNEWFGKDRIMTGVAYGIHEELVIEHGVHPESDEYWEKLDAGLRRELPHKFEASTTVASSASQPVATRHVDTVVAPATRNNGARAPQKIQLTESQVAIAKRLGLTLAQYAKEVHKEQQNV